MAPLVALLACQSTLPEGDPARPDLVLVSIDSLRADHLHSYGYARDTTPRLDALAARGLRFTRASAASPWTLPSHLTMLTGLWPTQHEVVEDTLRLHDDVPIVTEALHGAGYATGGFVSTVYVSGKFGFARGFDRYEDFGVVEATNLGHEVRTPDVLAAAEAWARDLPKGKPAFLFLHTYDVHYPYRPPPPYDAHYDPPGDKASTAYRTYAWYQKHPLSAERLQHQVDQYDESLRWVDALLGDFMARWEARRPVVWIVTADHGEELGERGSWGHAHTLHPEVMRVPLIVAGPGIAPAVRDDEAGTIDVAATLAALAGLSWPGDGRDLRAPIPPRPFWMETSRFDTLRLSRREGGARVELDLAGGAARTFEDADERAFSDATPAQVVSVLAGVGEQWELLDGEVRSAGALWRGGVVAGGALVGPGRFGAWPPDQRLRTASGDEVPPEGLPGRIVHHGRLPVGSDLSAATRAQLEALGYTQPVPQ